MLFKELIHIPEREDQDALVVVNDRAEDMRTGLIRLIVTDDVRKILLGEVNAADGTYVCAWKDRNEDARGPIPAVLIGPA